MSSKRRQLIGVGEKHIQRKMDRYSNRVLSLDGLRCRAKTTSGKQCENYAMIGSYYCNLHQKK
jgi:hypothetical protein